LTARNVEPIELSSDVAFFAFGAKEGFHDVVGDIGTGDLEHLRKFLKHRCDLHSLAANSQLNSDESKRIQADYLSDWLVYGKKLNPRELVFLTEQSFLRFPEKPVIDSLQY